MNEGAGLGSVVAKLLVLGDVAGDQWATVSSYVGSSEYANLFQVTPLQCGLDMYSKAEWILIAAFHWFLPKVVDVVAALSLTKVQG